MKPGALDHTDWLAPVAHLWLGSAQGWVQVSDETLRYYGQPDDFAPMIHAFTQRFPPPAEG